MKTITIVPGGWITEEDETRRRTKNVFPRVIGRISRGSTKRYMAFAAQRNNSNFAMMTDADMKQIFAPDIVWDVAGFLDEDGWNTMVSSLRTYNPTITICYYHSSCTARPHSEDIGSEGNYWKQRYVHDEDISEHEDWYLHDPEDNRVWWNKNQPNRSYLDMTSSTVRAYVIAQAVSLAQAAGVNAIGFDNCYHTYGIPNSDGKVAEGGQSVEAASIVSAANWEAAYLAFYQEAATACAAAHLKCIVNIASYANEISEAFDVASDYMDGVMSELAFHSTLRSDANVATELTGYETVLKKNKSVLIFPSSDDDESFALNKIRYLAERYGKIYCISATTAHWNSDYIYWR